MAFLGIPIIGGIIEKILGIGEKAADRLIPDKNKAQDQRHEGTQTQANITLEGERQRNYFTPRAIIMYAMAFAVIYGVVIQPFLKAFGIPAPVVDITPALRVLLGLLGLDLEGGG
jgi:hypothetical protein